MPTLHPPSPHYPTYFTALATHLSTLLAHAHVPITAIEHVGSTAVPGLLAKPVLDVDIVVAPEHVAAAIEALEGGGWRHNGNQGIEGREAFKSPADWRVRVGGEGAEEAPLIPPHISTHIYITTPSPALRNHLMVRDTLRSRPDLRAAYAAVKTALAGEDMEGYVRGKTGVLVRILREAGMGEDEIGEIRRANGG